MIVSIARVYDEPAGDGVRVLVDRIWPRGLRKDDARLDEWRKDVAPSTELRRWYGHDPDLFEQFARRYRAKLAEPAATGAVAELRALARTRPVVLLTATKDLAISNAGVLAEVLRAG